MLERYQKTIKTMEKLEFKDRLSSELATLFEDKTVSNENIYNVFFQKMNKKMNEEIEKSFSHDEILTTIIGSLNSPQIFVMTRYQSFQHQYNRGIHVNTILFLAAIVFS